MLPIAPLFSASLACCCCTGSSLSFGGPSSCSEFSISVAGRDGDFKVGAGCDASLNAEANAWIEEEAVVGSPGMRSGRGRGSSGDRSGSSGLKRTAVGEGVGALMMAGGGGNE